MRFEVKIKVSFLSTGEREVVEHMIRPDGPKRQQEAKEGGGALKRRGGEGLMQGWR